MGAAEFEQMYREHYTRLRNTAWQMLGDKDAAHDVVQEVFVKLWDKRESLDHILNQPAYLLRAVMNGSISAIGRNRKNAREVNESDSGSIVNSESLIIGRELERSIEQAIASLPPKCRAIFVLSRYEEKSYKEIAAITGLSIKTVENQMGIALKKMRDQLKPFLKADTLMIVFAIGTLLITVRLLVVPCIH